jgi:Rad3-related DNA helicase
MVVVLDRRLLTKSYRNLFLESLPDCKKMEGRMDDLPAVAKRWLNL